MKTLLKIALLLVPCVLALAVPIYNFDEPRLFGFPFFYWSLFALVPVSALFIYAVFRIDVAESRAKGRNEGRL
jgi:hypothetical protein